MMKKAPAGSTARAVMDKFNAVKPQKAQPVAQRSKGPSVMPKAPTPVAPSQVGVPKTIKPASGKINRTRAK